MKQLLRQTTTPILILAAALLVLTGFSPTVLYTGSELVGTVVAWSVFSITWKLRRATSYLHLPVVGVISLSIGVLNFLHTIASLGPQFGPVHGSSDRAQQFWIASRLLAAASFAVMPLLARRKPDPWSVLIGFMAVIVTLVAALTAGVFPTCLADGRLTPFYMVSEWVVAITFGGLVLFFMPKARGALPRDIYVRLCWFMALSGVTDLLLALPIAQHEISEEIGHLLMLVSLIALHTTISDVGFVRPYDQLVKELRQSEQALNQERDFFAAVVDTAGALVVLTDPAGGIVRFNRACEALTGYEEAEVLNRAVWDLLIPSEQVPRVQQVMKAVRPGSTGFIENHWRTKSGELRLISWANTVLTDCSGQVNYVIGTGQDITERHELQQELQRREERLHTILHGMQTGILVSDTTSGRVVEANPAALNLIGGQLGDVLGKEISALLSPAGIEELDLAPDSTGHELVLTTAAGRHIPVMVTSMATLLDGRACTVCSFMDISQRKELEDRLRALSLLDEMTGLYNRRGFVTLAEQQVKLAQRLGRGLLLLFVDLDGLKQINDTAGHAQGDAALREASGLLKATFRETDLIARLGGDEFVVLATVSTPEDAEALPDRLNENVRAHNADTAVPVSFSIGITVVPPGEPALLDDLLSRADALMYSHKKGKRNTGP